MDRRLLMTLWHQQW